MSTFMRKTHNNLTKHSPEILTGFGIAGMILSTVMAVKYTPKAIEILKKEKEKGDDISTIDKFKLTWRCYAPSIAIGLVSSACLIGAISVNKRRNAVLATAYSISESALREYRGKVVEKIGEKKEQQIRDDISQDRINDNPVTNNEIYITEKGNTLCYDVVSGRYFKSDIDKLKKIENELNRNMRDDMYISLNEFYYEIGLDPISIGDELGWNIDSGYIDLKFSSNLTNEGTPCLVVDYTIIPKYDFR